MPRKETKVTYPHSADAVWEFKAEYFEDLHVPSLSQHR